MVWNSIGLWDVREQDESLSNYQIWPYSVCKRGYSVNRKWYIYGNQQYDF